MVGCAFSFFWRRADQVGRTVLATSVIVGLLASASPLAMANAGLDVTKALANASLNISEEIECLALTIYFEARGEPDEGKIAVGHVVMNRAQNPQFPEQVCGVVRQGGIKRYRCQFTWWCDGRSDQPRDWSAWERSKALARSVFWAATKDPTQGALWYHADSVVPSWRNKLDLGPKIGRHIFYRPLESQRPASKISSQ